MEEALSDGFGLHLCLWVCKMGVSVCMCARLSLCLHVCLCLHEHI